LPRKPVAILLPSATKVCKKAAGDTKTVIVFHATSLSRRNNSRWSVFCIIYLSKKTKVPALLDRLLMKGISFAEPGRVTRIAVATEDSWQFGVALLGEPDSVVAVRGKLLDFLHGESSQQMPLIAL